MASALPSSPPAAMRPKTVGMLEGVFHRAAIAKRDPEREADHKAFTSWFQTWLDRNHISLRDLQRLLRVEYPTARKKRSGESPLSFVDIRRFPARHRRELTFAYLMWCDQSDTPESHR